MVVTDFIFDLGGVLLDLDMEGVGETCKRLGINPELFFVKAESPSPLGEVGKGSSTVCQGLSANQAVTAYQVGLVTSDEFLKLVLSHCAEGITREDVIEAWNACLGFIPRERLDMIKQLRRKGYGTHLLSNTNDLHWEEIKRRCFSGPGYTCHDLFDHVFVSHEVRLAKPDPDIYHYAVEKIGKPAGQCLFIDDTKVNVDAAKREGLQGAWLDISRKDHLCDILSPFFGCR